MLPGLLRHSGDMPAYFFPPFVQRRLSENFFLPNLLHKRSFPLSHVGYAGCFPSLFFVRAIAPRPLFSIRRTPKRLDSFFRATSTHSATRLFFPSFLFPCAAVIDQSCSSLSEHRDPEKRPDKGRLFLVLFFPLCFGLWDQKFRCFSPSPRLHNQCVRAFFRAFSASGSGGFFFLPFFFFPHGRKRGSLLTPGGTHEQHSFFLPERPLVCMFPLGPVVGNFCSPLFRNSGVRSDWQQNEYSSSPPFFFTIRDVFLLRRWWFSPPPPPRSEEVFPPPVECLLPPVKRGHPFLLSESRSLFSQLVFFPPFLSRTA